MKKRPALIRISYANIMNKTNHNISIFHLSSELHDNWKDHNFQLQCPTILYVEYRNITFKK